MRTLPIIGAGLMMLTACAGGQKENNYYVKANLGPDCEGKTVYLYDIDTDMNIASTTLDTRGMEAEARIHSTSSPVPSMHR